MKNAPLKTLGYAALFCLGILLLCGALCGCAVSFLNPGARDFIVVADISQVPESDAFGLTAARIERDSLKIAAIYTGGCRPHAFTLYAARAQGKEGAGNTAYLYVQHDANHDLCATLVSGEPVAFSLRGLKEALDLGGTAILRSAPQLDSGFALEY